MKPLRVAGAALQEARAYFEERGAEGCEGTAMLAGRPEAGIERCVIPDQVAYRSQAGVAVEVTEKGKFELAASLGPEERFLARIHSHPNAAFHSAADDRNAGLTAQGTLSIVVPFFGLGLRRGLSACAVFERRGQSWVPLSTEDVQRRIVVL